MVVALVAAALFVPAQRKWQRADWNETTEMDAVKLPISETDSKIVREMGTYKWYSDRNDTVDLIDETMMVGESRLIAASTFLCTFSRSIIISMPEEPNDMS